MVTGLTFAFLSFIMCDFNPRKLPIRLPKEKLKTLIGNSTLLRVNIRDD